MVLEGRKKKVKLLIKGLENSCVWSRPLLFIPLLLSLHFLVVDQISSLNKYYSL